MKLAIILSDTLPVPAVKGGAVQTGVQQIIDENEKHGKIDLTIYSIVDYKAEKLSRNYKNTKFVYLESNSKNQRLTIDIINKALKTLNVKKTYNCSPKYTKQLINEVNKESYDYILIKNAVQLVTPLARTNDNIYLQIHNDEINSDVTGVEKIYQAVKKIIVNSNYLKERVLTLKSAREEDILLNKNCTDVEIFNKNLYISMKEELKKKYNINDGEIVILFSGRTIPEKGIAELILAIKNLPSNINYKLLVVGSKGFGEKTKNKHLEYLKNLSNDISDNIVFTGYVPYKDLPKIHAISDIAVVPSIWEEPAGRVVIEAQASGLPVIVSDSGGIPDYSSKKGSLVVKRGDNFVNQLSHALETLIKDEDLRNEMGEAGHLFAKSFSPQRYYTELIEILNE